MKALKTRVALTILLTGLAGCGGGGYGESTPVTATPTPTSNGTVTLTGSVFMGAVSDATVTAYAADTQGKKTSTAVSSPVKTDGTGKFTITYSDSVPATVSGIVLVSTGGSYTSEADQSSQTAPELDVLVPTALSTTTAQINALTAAVTAAAQQSLASSAGTPSVSSAISTAGAAVVTAIFGSSTTIANPLTVDPNASPSSNKDTANLLALAGSLEQLRVTTKLTPADLYASLIKDMSDAKLDGLQSGKSIILPSTAGTTNTPVAASLFTTQLSAAAKSYASATSTTNPAVSTQASTAIVTGTQQSAQNAGVAIGSSGAVAPLQFQGSGTQIYYAARADGLIQLDMSNPAKPIAKKVTAVNSQVLSNTSSTTQFTSVDGIVINPTPTASGKIYGIIYSYSNSTIYSIDLTSSANVTVAESATLTIKNTASFSGASAQIAGGISDGTRNLVWLATGDGLMGIDPSNLKTAPITIAQPTGTQINENIGGDPANDIVYSVDYNNGTLVIFNLAEKKAYTMATTDWASLAGNSLGGAYSEIDGSALDSQYKVAIITPEYSASVGLLKYTTPSGTTGTTTGTITPVLGSFMSYTTPISGLAGAAIDPVSHTALFVGEGSSLGAGVLSDPSQSTWTGFSSFVGSNASSYQFEPHDPHMVGAFNIGGTPYGFLLQGYSSPYKIVVINLNAMLTATASNGLLSADPLLDSTISTLVSY